IGNGIGSADAHIAPGTDGSVGTAHIGALSLLSDAAYKFDLNSTAQTADLIMTSGLTDLSNGLAQFIATDLGSGNLPLGLTFTIIDNTSGSATIGFFAGLSDG